MAFKTLLSIFLLSAMPALAQTAEKTTIQIKYDIYSVRTSPGPEQVITSSNQDTLVLNGRNSIEQSKDMSVGSERVQMQGSTTLGAQTSLSGNTYGWRVGGPNRLLYRVSAPQNDIIASITVNGKSCTFQMVNRLKPGFKEYMQWSLQLKANATYSGYRYSNLSCTIQ